MSDFSKIYFDGSKPLFLNLASSSARFTPRSGSALSGSALIKNRSHQANEASMYGLPVDDATAVTTTKIDKHEVSVVRFAGDTRLYGFLEVTEGILTIYGRDEKELRQSLRLAMEATKYVA